MYDPQNIPDGVSAVPVLSPEEIERLRDSAVTEATRPCKKCGQKRRLTSQTAAPRPSCLECVEKHLGAAMVLLSEIHHGYQHRLRLIGHLHEAEEESQDWPHLHEMIRESRKAYQRDGVIPDWESLAQAATSATMMTTINS